MALELFDHQVSGKSFMLKSLQNRNGVLVADSMGMGKTIMTCSVLETLLRKRPSAKPALVCAPLSVLFHWQQEFARVGIRNVVVIHESNGTTYEDALGADVVISSYDGFRLAEAFHHNFNTIVLDEASIMKNHQSKIASLLSLVSLTCEHRIALTATPVENSANELFSIYKFVQPLLFGSNSAKFENDYGRPLKTACKSNSTEVSQTDGRIAGRRLYETIKPFLLRRLKKHSKQSDVVVSVAMTEGQKEIYQSVVDGHQQIFKSKRKKHIGGGKMVMEDFMTEGQRMLHLKQMAECVKVINGTHDMMSGIDTGKMVFFKEHLNDFLANGSKFACFFKQKALLKLVKTFLEEQRVPYVVITGDVAGDKRQQAIMAMNEGDARVLLGTSRAAGYGVNLLTINKIVILEGDWNAAIDIQTAARGSRPGNKEAVQVFRVVSPDTIEAAVDEVGSNKITLSRLIFHDVSEEQEEKHEASVSKAMDTLRNKRHITSFDQREHDREFHYGSGKRRKFDDEDEE